MRRTHQLRRAGRVSGLLALALISGCGGKDCCEPSAVLSIRLAPTNSGDQQTATVGTTLANPLRVLVGYLLDGRLEPAPGVTVRWNPQGDTVGTGGSISPASSTTDRSGIATATWTLGQVAGPQVAVATISGAAQDSMVTFAAAANPGPASQLRFAMNPTNTFTRHHIRPAVQVGVFDAFGNQITSPAPVYIALGAHTGSGALSGTTLVDAGEGVATFSDLSVDQAGAGYTLTASFPGVPAVTSAAFEIVTPGSGQIAFTSFRDGNGEIYVMNADGSARINLSNNSASDGDLAWSPEGSRIAFTSNRDGKTQIYVMNSDGSGVARLTSDTASDYAPVWSVDGSKIAFTSDRDGNGEVYVMHADGSNQVNLSNNSASDVTPLWSPDGTKIAFTSGRDGNAEVYVMDADGSNQINLSLNPADDRSPIWSPDGSRMAFTSTRDGHAEIYVMDADGSALSRVTTGNYPDVLPVWSPDGTTIAFVRDAPVVRRVCGRSGRSGGGGCRDVTVIVPRDIYTVHPDGSSILNLTNNGSAGLLSGSAAWSPDQSRVAFSSSRDGNWEILVMFPDGSGAVNLTHDPGSDSSPFWKPR